MLCVHMWMLACMCAREGGSRDLTLEENPIQESMLWQNWCPTGCNNTLLEIPTLNNANKKTAASQHIHQREDKSCPRHTAIKSSEPVINNIFSSFFKSLIDHAILLKWKSLQCSTTSLWKTAGLVIYWIFNKHSTSKDCRTVVKAMTMYKFISARRNPLTQHRTIKLWRHPSVPGLPSPDTQWFLQQHGHSNTRVDDRVKS